MGEKRGERGEREEENIGVREGREKQQSMKVSDQRGDYRF